MITPLISIIIPTYNRAHLIGETLDSVLAQTYPNWECIIVNDGSTDNTAEVVEGYVNRDARFQFHHRPVDRPKGANACRNYGFELCRGEYVNWFDSDDLMVENKLEIKFKNILENNSDFVISKTQNFNNKELFAPYKYNLNQVVSIEKFIKRHIHWYTCDVLLKREIAFKFRFHEKMKSWQDYYYFSLMLLETTNFSFIDTVLTKRRIHEDSIQDNMTKDKSAFYSQLLEAKYFTFKEIQHRVSKSLKEEMVFDLMNISYYLAKERKITKYASLIRKEIKTLRAKCLYYMALLSGFVLKKGEKFLQLAKGKSTALVK